MCLSFETAGMAFHNEKFIVLPFFVFRKKKAVRKRNGF